MQIVCDHIAAHVAQHLGPGDELPSLDRIEAELRVPRTVVRQALERLALEGLLVEHGDGFRVSALPNDKTRHTVGFLYARRRIASVMPPIEPRIVRYTRGFRYNCPDIYCRMLPFEMGGMSTEYPRELLEKFKALVLCPGDYDPYRDFIAGLDVPIVAMCTQEWRKIDHVKCNAVVYADLDEGFEQIFSHLETLGHRKIGIVGYQHGKDLKRQCEKFPRASEIVGLVELGVKDGVFDYSTVSNALARNDVTAWIACDEYIADKLLSMFAANGVRVPDDVSVVALFYPFRAAGGDVTGLDSMALAERMGRNAGVAVLDILEEKTDEDLEYWTTSYLKIGGTTGPAPAGA